jgi:lipopolysaccharide export system protein LptA
MAPNSFGVSLERKSFFFEKKKQKTFTTLLQNRSVTADVDRNEAKRNAGLGIRSTPVSLCHLAPHVSQAPNPGYKTKIIESFLVLFFKKEQIAVALALATLCGTAYGQALDLSHGGPITVTARGGIDWNQAAQTVTAHDDARATRGAVTVTADVLIAHYRKKAAATALAPTPAKGAVTTPAPASGVTGAPDDTGNNEIYRLDAEGHVHIFTATDQAWGDHGVYDIDQAVLVLTGRNLRLTTPTNLMTARDAMEYWSVKHLAIGRGDASVTSNDGRRITADTLVGYTTDSKAPGTAPASKPGKTGDPLAASGKLQKVEAYGHVQVRTATEIINGDRGVYLPDSGLSHIVGHVHITRGENQLNGAAAIVNMRTGLATLTQAPGARVQGLVVPNESQPAQAAPEKKDSP